MKTVISASRRTDLPAGYPGWLADALNRGEVSFTGPRGRRRTVDLRPESVHTLVLWSKDFAGLLSDRAGLRAAVRRYRQIYFLFTVTGLGGSSLEPGAPDPEKALAQLPGLVDLAGLPGRVSLRFDPVVFWEEGGAKRDNLGFFVRAAEAARRCGVTDIRFSFAQWYGRAQRRAEARRFLRLDPAAAEKAALASLLAAEAGRFGLNLFACAQEFPAPIPGLLPSACIDGRRLAGLHPDGEPASAAKDRGQRAACGCTASVDIGSYEQTCPHGCVYCYGASPV